MHLGTRCSFRFTASRCLTIHHAPVVVHSTYQVRTYHMPLYEYLWAICCRSSESPSPYLPPLPHQRQIHAATCRVLVCIIVCMFACVRACVADWDLHVHRTSGARIRLQLSAPVVCIYGLNTNRKFEFKYVRRQQFVRKVCCGGRHEVGSLQWLHAQRIDRSLCMQSIRKYLRVLVSLNASPLFF